MPRGNKRPSDLSYMRLYATDEGEVILRNEDYFQWKICNIWNCPTSLDNRNIKKSICVTS